MWHPLTENHSSLSDNMGLICNELDRTLRNEVNNEDEATKNSPTNSSSEQRRQPVKQSTHHKPRNFLYTLFKWYFKSRALQDEYSQTSASDYEISIENINALGCNDDESSLAYRQHKNPHQTRSSSANTTLPSSSSSSNLSHSHYLVRQSICLYAASSVILALCYLATPSSASAESASHPV